MTILSTSSTLVFSPLLWIKKLGYMMFGTVIGFYLLDDLFTLANLLIMMRSVLILPTLSSLRTKKTNLFGNMNPKFNFQLRFFILSWIQILMMVRHGSTLFKHYQRHLKCNAFCGMLLLIPFPLNTFLPSMESLKWWSNFLCLVWNEVGNLLSHSYFLSF